MQKNKAINWEKEFLEYLKVEPSQVPSAMSEEILEKIRIELNPAALYIFCKIALIQFFAGTLTLLFCPQFGITFTSSQGLMPYLMKYGEHICMLGCGALFTGTSLFVVSILLRPEEIRILKEHEILQLAVLSMLSLGALLCFGGQVIIALGLAWGLGSILGGFLSLEAGWALRKSILKRAVL